MSLKNSRNPYIFLLKNSKKLILWAILFFSFDLNFNAAEFHPIRMSSSYILALIFAIDLSNLVEKYLNRVEQNLLTSFRNWHTKQSL